MRASTRPEGRRRTRTRTRVMIGTLLVVVVVVGLGLIAYLTPLMSVRSTDVHDNRAVSSDEILKTAKVPSGTPLLRVDTKSVAQRIAAIPSVESARVQRSYPSSLTITIVERTPVARLEDGGKTHVLDRSGIAYLTYDRDHVPGPFAKLPKLSTPNPGPNDPTTKAALGVVVGLPPTIRGKVLEIDASSPVDISFGLGGNRTVVWGDGDQGAEKARTLTYLLSRKATTYNVSAPDFPAYR